MPGTYHGTCSGCRFFVPSASFGGHCHRKAPDVGEPNTASGKSWPFLSGRDFCGEGEAGV